MVKKSAITLLAYSLLQMIEYTGALSADRYKDCISEIISKDAYCAGYIAGYKDALREASAVPKELDIPGSMTQGAEGILEYHFIVPLDKDK